MINESNDKRKQELQERSRRVMEESLYHNDELEWKAAYFQEKQEVMYCNWRAEQEKLRSLVWKYYGRKIEQPQANIKDNFGDNVHEYEAIYCPDYYRSNYPETAREHGKTEIGLLKYFLSEGIQRGDQGCIGFNVWSYRKWNPDLDELFKNNLKNYYKHYMKEGFSQKRRAFGMPGIEEQTVYKGIDYKLVYRFYDYLYYNPDVLETFGLDPDRVLEHFVERGMDERRRSKTDFYVVLYRMMYDDLENAFGNQYRKYYEHYLRDGWREGRKGVY